MLEQKQRVGLLACQNRVLGLLLDLQRRAVFNSPQTLYFESSLFAHCRRRIQDCTSTAVHVTTGGNMNRLLITAAIFLLLFSISRVAQTMALRMPRILPRQDSSIAPGARCSTS